MTKIGGTQDTQMGSYGDQNFCCCPCLHPQ